MKNRKNEEIKCLREQLRDLAARLSQADEILHVYREKERYVMMTPRSSNGSRSYRGGYWVENIRPVLRETSRINIDYRKINLIDVTDPFKSQKFILRKWEVTKIYF